MSESTCPQTQESTEETFDNKGNTRSASDDFFENIKLAQDSVNHIDDYILYGTNSFTDSYKKDIQDLKKRLKTYTLKNWKISSLKITPLKCALLGWVSISPDYIQCEQCKKCISLKYINGEKKNCLTYNGNIQILKKELKLLHKNFCRNRLLFNYNQLEKCYNMLTQYDIKECEKSFNKSDSITWDIVKEDLKTNGLVSDYLAQHGYYYEKQYVKCTKCFYEIHESRKNFINPKVHHKKESKKNPILTINRLEVLIKELKDDTLKAIEEKNTTKPKEKFNSKILID
ncbi:Zinc finger, C3HC-like domain-containing protein [Strongyloides ratti]|uniref:Zinc finger, C3HC-like domain-containing protein n=1 Tax=Strongyloides ratti TaxID=34506 RepID=A0A090MZJ1_STRRB|nr:Zinc finger, C3HC-like domain-containing protein [Strongyloides ratti]CEF69024.1 Zinc finger, C3HC-like domain-containing protein [Strongyloides ratti]